MKMELNEKEIVAASSCLALVLYQMSIHPELKFKDETMFTDTVELYKKLRKAQGVDLYESTVN